MAIIYEDHTPSNLLFELHLINFASPRKKKNIYIYIYLVKTYG
jgi:hypothetical protein